MHTSVNGFVERCHCLHRHPLTGGVSMKTIAMGLTTRSSSLQESRVVLALAEQRQRERDLWERLKAAAA